MELQIKLCVYMEIIYYCEDALLLRNGSADTCASATYYQMDSVAKAVHYKVKHVINLQPDPTILIAGDMILSSNLSK